MQAKRIADGYRVGRYTWAIVIEHAYGFDIVESGFATKRDALAWLARQGLTVQH